MPKGVHKNRVLKPCGTVAAYRRHKRRGELVDEKCRKAWSVDVAKHRKGTPRKPPTPEQKKAQLVYQKKYFKARARALTKLSHRYPGVYNDLFDAECAKEGIERKRRWSQVERK